MEKKPTPKQLSKKAREIWEEITLTYEMVPSDYPLLELALTCWDEMRTIKAKIDKDGFILGDGKKRKAHPGISALKESRLVFLRTWKLLGFPVSLENDNIQDHRGFGRPSNLTKERAK
jgi:phage terminase small subunit